jgi:hypothetical protein
MNYAVKMSFAALMMISVSGAAIAQDTAQFEIRSLGNEGVPGLDSPVFYERPDAVGGGGDNLGSHNATQDIDVQWNRVINLNNPTEDYHAATKWYVDNSGGGGAADNLGNHRATRDLNMSWNRIKDLNNPTDPYHAANKWYVDQAIAGISGGGDPAGDNMGDHGARMNVSMNGFTLWNLGYLDMEGGDIKNSNIKTSTLHQPTSFGGMFNNPNIQWGYIADTYADRLIAQQSELNDSVVNNSVINSPEVHLMKAYDSTQFFGFNEHFNDVWMHGNQIKEAKIAHSLDMQMSPLLNVPDPVDIYDAANLNVVKIKNTKLKIRIKVLEAEVTRLDDLDARITALENQ